MNSNRTTFFRLQTLLLFLLAINLTWATADESSNEAKGKSLPASYFSNNIVSGGSTARITGLDVYQNVTLTIQNPQNPSKTKSVKGGAFKGTVDGQWTKFYCVDLFHPVKYYSQSNPHEYTDENDTPSEITYILNNYYPNNNANGALSNKKEATSIQLALWHYSDNVDVTTVQENSNDAIEIKQRALQIIADADANAGNTTPVPTLSITPATQMLVNGNNAVFTITAKDENNNPISGLSVSLSSTAGTLSSQTITTDNSGEAIVSLVQNGAAFAELTASATVSIPVGTRFVHKIEPNKYQKLALGKSASSVKTVTGQVAWYNNGGGDCELGGLMTFTQGGWGSPSNSGPGQIRDTYFDDVFSNGLVIGGTNTLTLTSAQAVKDFIPAGGTSSYLTQSYTDVNSTSAGVLAGQLVAATLNVEYDKKGYLGNNTNSLAALVFLGGPFDGMSIDDFLVIANDAIGGNQNTGYSFSQINDAATSINENFDNGTVDKGKFTCYKEPCKNIVGDFVWHDRNANGMQDNGEEGIEGVSISLSGEGLNKTTVTDASGKYEFTEIPNGTYTIKVDQSNFNPGNVFGTVETETQTSKWFITRQDIGTDDTKDSDGDKVNRAAIVTLDCEDNPTIDFGFVKSCLIFEKSGTVGPVKEGDVITYNFYVSNCGDVKFGGGVSIYDEMFNPNGNHKIEGFKLKPGEEKTITRTYTVVDTDCGTEIVNNAYAIGHSVWTSDTDYNNEIGNDGLENVRVDDDHKVVVICEEPASLGDRLWYDDNQNGIQDNGENGVANVWISLYDCSDVFVKKMKTDNNGLYLFDDLTPGDYYVLFELPNGYKFTTKNAGNDSAVDSDADEITGKTVCTTLESGENDLTWDAGIYQEFAAIGDYVWYDTNNNGLQDVGEDGVEGVTVNLYDCNGNSKGTTTTNADGWYHFDDLVPGDYKVEFVKPNGSEFSPQNEGSDSEIDSDADENTGLTTCITLAAGDVDDSWDAGIYQPEPEEADIVLTKVVSNDSPDDGEVITYTIKVTNNGPKDAEDVEVTDVLPAGVIIQSYSTSNGSLYNDNSGIWTVGSLVNQAMATLTISVKVDVGTAYTTAWDFGPAKDYNLFVLYDIDQPSSDTEGKVAVGRNAKFASYSIGDKLQAGGATEDVLIVGKKLTFESGRVYNGNVVYGHNTNLPKDNVSIDEGSLRKDTPIDFAAARSYLTNLSSQLAALDSNATAKVESWGEIFLTGNDPYLNIFELKGSELTATNSVVVNVPNGSVVLVNISGKTISWSGGLSITGTSKSNVLYNFYQAKNLHVVNIDIRGSVLAPKAVLDFEDGVINGQVVAKHVKGKGQFNNVLFTGHIPESTCVTNIAEVTASSMFDPNSANGSDFVIFCVGYEGGGTPDPGTTPQPDNDWEISGNFGINEIVWSFTFDADGNIYAGTYGGKIYLSIDQGSNWILINDGMNVAVIWSLLSHDEFIFAATEQGIFRYDGTSWTLVGLAGIDVRSIAVDNDGNLYAGTWGSGVYKSTDLGITWTEINAGLDNFLVINSITVTQFNEIIISTVGGGIAVSVNGGVSWDISNTSFLYAWTLDVTSDGVIYAGTYGSGLHFSTDGGYTWELTSAGLEAEFIYSITVDIEDNIYVSSFNSGVHVSYDGGINWENLGLGGFGISTIFVNNNSSSSSGNNATYANSLLIAGTKTGQVYSKEIGSVTDVKQDDSLPTEFSLDQNYPNPFNPTTQIKFSVPQAGEYNLKVYNVIGQEVATLVNGQMTAGKFTVTFEASHLASGMYIYQLVGNNVKITKKMLLMK